MVPDQESNENVAASQPTGQSDGQQQDHGHNQERKTARRDGISSGAVNGIAIGASAGAVFILAILFYLIWRRRRRRASCSPIARFPARSDGDMLGPGPRSDRLTALPTYRKNRWSVWSSRHDYVTIGQPAWKSSHPPRAGSAEARAVLRDASTIPSQHGLTPPEPAHTSSRMRRIHLPARKDSTADNPGRGLSLRSSTDLSGTSTSDRGWALKGVESPEDNRDPERWSWSNSNAPPTPRFAAPNARSSLQTTASRNLAAWRRHQSRRDAFASDHALDAGPKPRPKKHASRPLLSPKIPMRTASRAKHGRGIFKRTASKAQSKANISASPHGPRVRRVPSRKSSRVGVPTLPRPTTSTTGSTRGVAQR